MRLLANRLVAHCNTLARDTRAIAMVEFAFMGPILLLLGLVGIEMSNLAMAHMRISQAAMHVADNASRIGDRDQLAAQRIFESDINDLFVGVSIQAGERLGLMDNGRVIISSLERNNEGGQTIRWQRCMGLKDAASAYGAQGTGATGTGFTGMGRPGRELRAGAGQAVMYVEIVYDYQPVMANSFVERLIETPEIRSEAAFTVRGVRDLTGVFQRAEPAPVSTCNRFQAEP